MDLLINASLIAAFFAGIAALLAPCCITVLLPTYLASIFKQKSQILLLTVIFTLGLLAVFLPLGLGVTWLSRLLAQYHNAVFLAGGVLLILLGVTLAAGKIFSFSSPVHPQFETGGGWTSVFILGVFSAIATSCCAPVLAGVVAVSAVAGSYIWGAAFTLTYVLGMVSPLFILAVILDKKQLTRKLLGLRQTANLISGVMFLGLGILIVILSLQGKLQFHSGYQLSVNIYIAKLTKLIEGVISQ